MALIMSSPTTSVPISTSVGPEDNESWIIRFTDMRELFQAIDGVSGDILIVTDVSPRDFDEIDEERTIRRRKFRFRRYIADSHTLIITIPNILHETLHLQLDRQLYKHLVQMNIDSIWKPIGTTTFRARGNPAGDGGEGDSAGGPLPQRSGRNSWPTLVIEAGYSQSLESLRADMRWWFATSNHDVKIVLLTKFDRRERQIILEKWEEEPAANRLGATTTRRAAVLALEAAALQPVLRQSIIIRRNDATNPVSYHVSRGALVLGFRLLFLRNPGPLEGDIIINIRDLQHYAERVWSEL